MSSGEPALQSMGGSGEEERGAWEQAGQVFCRRLFPGFSTLPASV